MKSVRFAACRARARGCEHWPRGGTYAGRPARTARLFVGTAATPDGRLSGLCRSRRVARRRTLIARGDKIAYFRTIGFQDREKQTPIKADTIFRLASMTKPIVSVAAMMLVEEGKIDLAAPVSKYIPEFADLKVGIETIDPATGKPTLTLVPQKRPMIVQDLLAIPPAWSTANSATSCAQGLSRRQGRGSQRYPRRNGNEAGKAAARASARRGVGVLRRGRCTGADCRDRIGAGS